MLYIAFDLLHDRNIAGISMIGRSTPKSRSKGCVISRICASVPCMGESCPLAFPFRLRAGEPDNLEASSVRHDQTLARSYFQGHCNGKVLLNNRELVLRSVADNEASDGQSVYGALWQITPECESALDRHEEFPRHYSN